ncbi:hypothetical protein MG293_010291 [Ovis ammon polii]|uniref:K Homology domain-containing protein n=1 Tax=Ovis ammon polii TaxID=230172 RepID=A0AAD4U7H5_OVIAM|nr:hypothetical protein MG293_010291 [Ovis ammon polii]
MEEKYLPELMAEKDSLDPSFTHALRLVNQEIEKFQKGEGKDEEKYIDVVINKNMKLGQKVLIPVKQFPKFNFVGKLLGPRGNSLKRLQEETLTKMSILGKGSMRDKAKEEELRKSGEAKYFHLNDDLHVLIEVFAPPAEAYARMGHALEEIKKFLIPDYNDEIRQAQLQELTYLNGGSENADVPVVRGKPTLRTRGVPTPAITSTINANYDEKFVFLLLFLIRSYGNLLLKSAVTGAYLLGVPIASWLDWVLGVRDESCAPSHSAERAHWELSEGADSGFPRGTRMSFQEQMRVEALKEDGAFIGSCYCLFFSLETFLVLMRHRKQHLGCPETYLRVNLLVFVPRRLEFFRDYDDGYGTAYDEQSYDSYDNSYSAPTQSGADYYDYGHGLSEETYDSYEAPETTTFCPGELASIDCRKGSTGPRQALSVH